MAKKKDSRPAFWDDPGIQLAVKEGRIPAEQIAGTPLERFIPGRCAATIVEAEDGETSRESRPKRTRRAGARSCGEEEKRAYVDPIFLPQGVWVIPLKVSNGTNGSLFNYARVARAGIERKKVAEFLGTARSLRTLADFREHLDAGLRIRIEMVKLGPGQMDDDSLPPAFKYCRDTVALFLGFDDGPKNKHRWDWVYGQEQSSPRTGIRIKITKYDAQSV